MGDIVTLRVPTGTVPSRLSPNGTAGETPVGVEHIRAETLTRPYQPTSGPFRGMKVTDVEMVEDPHRGDQRGNRVADELIAASAGFYYDIHSTWLTIQNNPKDPAVSRWAAAADHAHQRRILAWTRRLDYIQDIPDDRHPLHFINCDYADDLLTTQAAYITAHLYPRIADWTTRWCDAICCNPGGNTDIGTNPYHQPGVASPAPNLPVWTEPDRHLLRVAAEEANLIRQLQDIITLNNHGMDTNAAFTDLQTAINLRDQQLTHLKTRWGNNPPSAELSPAVAETFLYAIHLLNTQRQLLAEQLLTNPPPQQ